MINSQAWYAVAATAALVGAAWQCLQALLGGIKSMDSFLGAHNELLRDERARIRSKIPAWRIRRGRAAVREMERGARQVLTSNELELSNAYDRQAGPWSWVLVGALIAAVASWVQTFN